MKRVVSLVRNRQSFRNLANESVGRGEHKYVFRQVRNDSIIRDFALGMISPQLLKVPDERLPNPLLPNLVSRLDRLSRHQSNSECVSELKEMGMFGAMIPKKYGGMGLSLTHYAYLMQHESLLDWVLSLTAHQNLCAQAILLYGSEEHKTKYLPLLASGKMVGAFCLSEDCSGSDMMAMKTVGVINALGSHYVVDGTKNWVLNGSLADLMVVFVRTQDTRYEGGREYLTGLIVEKAMTGVSVSKLYEVPCLHNSHLADVSFESVFVPVENVLFEDHGGYKIANHVQNNARAMLGPCVAGLARVLVNDMVDKMQAVQLHDDSRLRHLLNECLTHLFAVESCLFFTTRLADQYEVAEIELESAAVKVFSIESAKMIVDCYMEALSLCGCTATSQMTLLCNRVDYLRCFLGSNHFVRLYVGGTMVQLSDYTFLEMKERLKSPIDNFSWLKDNAKNMDNNSKWTEQLKDSRYGQVVSRSEFLADLKSIYKKLQISRIELCKAMMRYKEETIDRQIIIEAMSHIGVLVYVVSCCVARANTNYGDFEISCSRRMIDSTRLIIDSAVASIRSAANHGDFSLLPYLSKDIQVSGGYHSANILELGSVATPEVEPLFSRES